MSNPWEEHPILYATLVALQMIAMGLAALVVMNMLIDYTQSSPVPQCPKVIQ